MRAFLAVEVPVSVREGLQAEQDFLATRLEGVRWAPASSIHLTVVFLGEVSESLEAGLTEEAARACARIPAGRLRIGGLGCFPPRGRPGVLWIGIGDDTNQTLEALHRGLSAAVAQVGIAVERRPLAPHLTLGRAKRGLHRGTVQAAFKARGDVDLGEMPLDRCVLFQSVLGPAGARHLPRSSLPLGAG